LERSQKTCLFYPFSFCLSVLRKHSKQSEKPVMVSVDEETIQEAIPEEVYRDFQNLKEARTNPVDRSEPVQRTNVPRAR